MTAYKNDLPLFAEVREQETTTLQKIFSQFQQPIPSNFVELKTVGENYMRTTPSSWPKPVCERYNFSVGEEWITLDIPHSILEKLELNKGKEIAFPIYLAPEVLTRKEVCKGIALENENEIFLNRPLTINNLGRELTRWLKEIESLKTQITNLETEKEGNQETITNLQNKYDLLLKGGVLLFQRQIQIIDALKLWGS